MDYQEDILELKKSELQQAHGCGVLVSEVATEATEPKSWPVFG